MKPMNDILAILSGGDYVSGEKISQELGISRAAVWKRIAQLREDGWQIEAAGVATASSSATASTPFSG
jgi:biotin operon repressor BirA-like protein